LSKKKTIFIKETKPAFLIPNEMKRITMTKLAMAENLYRSKVIGVDSAGWVCNIFNKCIILEWINYELDYKNACLSFIV
jgi:hypothetical protein